MITAQYADNRLSPLAHWLLDGDITDSSGNGLDLSVAIGNQRYAELVPGVRGFFFDGATRLFIATPAALQLNSDMTFVAMVRIPPQGAAALSTIVGTWASGETEATNVNYEFNVRGGGSRGLNLTHEYGSGTNDPTDSEDVIDNSTVMQLAIRRDVSALTYEVLCDTHLLSTHTFTNASTGGSSCNFTLGGAGYGQPMTDMTMADVQIYGSKLTDDQLKSVYNMTRGHIEGVF